MQYRPNPVVSADQKITVSSSVVNGTDNAIDATTSMVKYTAEGTDGIRVTFNGTTPDASTGHLLSAGDTGYMSADEYNSAKFIRGGASDGTLTISEMILYRPH